MADLSRREFVVMAGATLVASKLAHSQQGKLTAGEVVDRIKKNLGIPWDNKTFRDTYKIGGPDSPVRGIVSTFGSNLSVMQRGLKAGLNMIITHEPTFWSDADLIDLVKNDPLYKYKLDYATKNHIVVWRIHDHWHSYKPDGKTDGIRAGWLKAMNWTQYEVNGDPGHFEIPPTTLRELALYVANHLEARSVRVIGDPNLRVATVAFGGNGLAQNMKAIESADCGIAGESREYESYEYVRDAILAGGKKGAIFASHEASEGMGTKALAEWLKPFVPEVPVEFIPTIDEFWAV